MTDNIYTLSKDTSFSISYPVMIRSRKTFTGQFYMKAILVMGLFVISTSAFSAVFKSYDSKHSCNLYRVGANEETTPRAGEQVVTTKNVYGLSFSDLEIDFESREASVQIIKNVALGFNTSLVQSRSIIPANHPDFTSLINQVNRKVYLLEKVCISSSDKIVYVSQFEEQKE